jgi:hypothetical protein
MRRLLVPTVALACVGGLAVGCSNSTDQPEPAASPGVSPVTSTSASATDVSTPPSPSTSASAPTGTPTSPMPSGGTSSSPAPVTAATDLLDWKAVPGSVQDSQISNGTWTLTVAGSGGSYTLTDGSKQLGSKADTGYRVGTALLDKDWAVAVFQDDHEEGTEPDRAQVTDLETGKQFVLDHDSEVPTTVGGTWALGADTLLHATRSPAGAYCLATVSLESGAQTRGYCAPPQHGFNSGHVTAAGTTLLTFDDARPSCRTVGSVSGTTFTPFPGVVPCTAWEGVLLGSDSAVWSVIPKENRVEAADFQARVGDSYYDLGPGTSGTLVPCAGAAYFVRDPQRGQPGRLGVVETAAGADAAGRHLDVPTGRVGDPDERALVGLVRSLVLGEPYVAVRAKDLDALPVGGELVAQRVDQRDHRGLHGLVVHVPVRVPEALGVVDLEVVVEVERRDGEPGELHRPSLRSGADRQPSGAVTCSSPPSEKAVTVNVVSPHRGAARNDCPGGAW